MNGNDDLLNIALKTEQAGCRKDDTQCCGKCKKPTYEELEAQVKLLGVQLELSVAAERAWETTMMEACGEDGPASVAAEIKALRAQRDTAMESLRQQLSVLAAENTGLKDFVKTCFHAAGDGCDMDGNDIQELGERLGLFGRETYQPALHGYICGHEAGEDTVYVMNKTQATDAFLAEVLAQGVEMYAEHLTRKAIESGENKNHAYAYLAANFAAQLRQGGERELTNLERNVLECAAVIAKDRERGGAAQ